jgi:hypothetical protein
MEQHNLRSKRPPLTLTLSPHAGRGDESRAMANKKGRSKAAFFE